MYRGTPRDISESQERPNDNPFSADYGDEEEGEAEMSEMSSVTLTEKSDNNQDPFDVPGWRLNKSRLELDEDEPSDNYWADLM